MFDLEDEKREFRDREYREAYADEFLNTYVANQIRVLREQRGLTQNDLAAAIGTHQAGVSRIENVNYSAWNVKTLRKVAYAFDCRLHISFETYGSLLTEGASFRREALQRPSFENDPFFRNGKLPRKGTTEKALGKVLPFPGQTTSIGVARAVNVPNLQEPRPKEPPQQTHFSFMVAAQAHQSDQRNVA